MISMHPLSVVKRIIFLLSCLKTDSDKSFNTYKGVGHYKYKTKDLSVKSEEGKKN